MKLSDFKYDLPQESIAQYPTKKRGESRLLLIDKTQDKIEHKNFKDIIHLLDKNDVLIVNETRVFPARLKAMKDKTNAEVELLLLRELEHDLWETLVRPARKVRVGNKLKIGDKLHCEVVDNTLSGGRVVRFEYDGDFDRIIDAVGEVPLPPYIKRESQDIDKERYQSVFASKRGAVAAPTASLHFDKKIIKKLEHKGVQIVPVLLHVGLGTFRPITVEDFTRHKMDSEYYEVSEEAAEKINAVIDSGGRVIAVGTTVVRVLETASSINGHIRPESGWTDKFIFPPYDFKVVKGLITNFHQPASTLIMLVSAFAGRELILSAYEQAKQENYRFFSYGDAMFIH